MKRIFAIIMLLFIFDSVFMSKLTASEDGYSIPNIVPVSPNAASLGVFGSIPVGHYTGIPDISIPLYEIDLDGKKIPVSLAYHASGIKVAQEASWVGMGWALNAGGCITREMRGGDDFSHTGNLTGYYFNTASFPNENNYDQYTGEILYHAGEEIANGKADVNPDLFHYNFAGHTGSMFVNKSQHPDRSPKASFKKVEEYLDATVHISYPVTFWTVVDGDGYKYYFGGSDNSAEKHTSYSHSTIIKDGQYSGNLINEIDDDPVTTRDRDQDAVVMTWYLDSIVSPAGNKIEFQYATDAIVTPFHRSEKKSIRVTDVYATHGGGGIVGSNPVFGNHHVQLSFSYAKVFQKLLKKIIFPSGTIDFRCSDRNDLLSSDENRKSQKLEEINISGNTGSVKTIQFHYSYSGDQSSYKTCRLFLDKINERNGNKTDFEHRFEYSGKGQLPPKYSKNIDFWGYYNNGVNIGSWQSFNNIHPANPNEGTLVPTSIVYQKPDRSAASFEEQFSNMTQVILYGADRIPNAAAMQYGMLTSVQYPTGGKSRFVYEPHTFDNSFKSGIDRKQLHAIDSVKINDIGTVMKTLQLDEDALIYYDLSVIYTSPSGYNINGNNRAYLVFDGDGENFPPYDYSGCEAILNYDRSCSYIRAFPILPVRQTKATNSYQHTFLKKGTYRVYVAVNPACMNEPNRLTAKIGRIDKKTVNFGAGLRIKEIVNTDISDNALITKQFEYTNGCLMFSPVHFEEQQYTIKPLHGIDSGFYAFFLSGSSNSIRDVTDRSYYQFSETEVGYTAVDETVGTGNGKIRRIFRNARPPLAIGGINNTLPNENGLPDRILFYDDRQILIKDHKYSYTSQQKDLISGFAVYYPLLPVKIYAFGNYGEWHNWITLPKYNITSDWWKLDKETVTENTGNGSVVTVTDYVYNSQNYLPKKITTVNSQNITVEQVIKYPHDYTNPVAMGMVDRHLVNLPVEKISLHNNSVVKAVKTDYKDTLNTYLPKVLYSMKSLSSATLADYASLYQPEIYYDRYSSRGKHIQLRGRDNVPTVYFWGYNGQYPIIEVKNIAYDNIRSSLSPPGQGFYNAFMSQINPPDSMIRSFGDMLRRELTGAFVTIYTYKPLVGMTSQTDPRGVTTYYEYDGFGRLKETYRMENGEKRIVQAYDYHYAEP